MAYYIIVREALDPVHVAIQNRHIISVKFLWVSYLVSWSRSGPGYYAGISLSKEGGLVKLFNVLVLSKFLYKNIFLFFFTPLRLGKGWHPLVTFHFFFPGSVIQCFQVQLFND